MTSFWEQDTLQSVQETKRCGKSAAASLSEKTDEELAVLLQNDVQEALDILVLRYKDALLNFIFRFLGNMELSRDVLQETFIRLWEKRSLYRSCGRFSTWIYTIAANLARSELRRPSRRLLVPVIQHDAEGEEYEIPLRDTEPLPDRVADTEFRYRRIQEALLALPVVFREAVILCDIQELAYEEIAAIIGQPIGTVKSRINRGRAMLRSMLRDIYD
ncbi:MAG: sigma-70 family RNA polymerase sigma factor [Bacteroidota bacterium]|nr:sigma-70 family RNA polymerase sigma factor [Bacteroidota bacterium]